MTTSRLDSQVDPPHHFAATRVEASPPLSLDLQSGAIRTILWATGYRPDYAWLDVPVVDAQGHVRHDGGVVASPGMYIIGLPVLRCRRSTFIDGADNDARYLSAHLASYLAHGRTTRVRPCTGLADRVDVGAPHGALSAGNIRRGWSSSEHGRGSYGLATR
jgi:putative flavoprotein involved in K+ transport